VPSAARLHTARSRNDQVATDVRLFFRHACKTLIAHTRNLQRALVEIASVNANVLIPGYTHLQRAQPVSIAHHLLAYVEMFDRDARRFSETQEHANVCPLGAGALAGTTLPIDRAFTAKKLGFVDKKGRAQVTTNSMDSVADRDLFIEFATACALSGVHLSRLAEDLILWSSTEFGFVSLPDAFCTGSSLMPQKKNPDSLELLRGKSARLQGNVQTLFTLAKGLPLTYNRDLQEDKIPVFDSFDQLALSLEVAAGTISGITVNEEKCAAAVADPALLATDLADWLVLRGLPFRDAHHVVGAMVAAAEKLGCTLPEIPDKAAIAINSAFKNDWRPIFDLKSAMKKRTGIGMPGPKQVQSELRRWQRALEKSID
jgi:argininosuccinate lyase